MIRAEQIPDEVVEAAVKAWKEDTQSFRPNAETIAAAINAWPNVFVNGRSESIFVCCHSLVLPLPQEVSDGF